MGVTKWVSEAPERVRERVNRGVRRAVGLTQEPPEACTDSAEAYLPVDGLARLVHGDLTSMMIGGLGSLFFEMLHPHTMAGVAEHSRYQNDALGRVLQTANFIGATTYGSCSSALHAIERVRAIHEGVRGVTDNGEPYYANDPHLLSWVHCAGTSMFLASYQRFGPERLSRADADTYVREVATTARDLGAENPPTSQDELRQALDAFRPELRLSEDARAARDFVARGVVEGPHQRAAYRLLVNNAYSLLEPWARDLLGVSTAPALERTILRPTTRVLASALRRAIPPTTRLRSA